MLPRIICLKQTGTLLGVGLLPKSIDKSTTTWHPPFFGSIVRFYAHLPLKFVYLKKKEHPFFFGIPNSTIVKGLSEQLNHRYFYQRLAILLTHDDWVAVSKYNTLQWFNWMKERRRTQKQEETNSKFLKLTSTEKDRRIRNKWFWNN